MGTALLGWKILRAFGLGWIAYRTKLGLESRLNVLQRRLPTSEWQHHPLSDWLHRGIPADPASYVAWHDQNAPRLFAPTDAADVVSASVLREAEAVLLGELPYFSKTVAGKFPPDWQSGEKVHFSRMSAEGDIKLAWELNRFSMAYVLARAYARSREERFAEGFWTLFEDWCQHNPPNTGLQWKCGQESTFRVMAWLFASEVMRDAAASTVKRRAALSTAIAQHAQRIAGHIDYARSQKNNHAISEAVGLLTIAYTFPEFESSSSWASLGTRILEEAVAEQVYEDGSYAQHSFNYTRVMMHDLLWMWHVCQAAGMGFPSGMVPALRRSAEFMYQMMDESGAAPNYGANDGALVLPLSSCDYTDYRPVVQAAWFVTHGSRIFEAGPWDEELLWIAGTETLSAPLAPHFKKSLSTSEGYVSLRGRDTWAMTRGARYRHRPGHADQLHCDIWWRGIKLLADSGTYSYNAAWPFDSAFKSTRFHNTVEIDGRDQMTDASRFMWVDWSKGKINRLDTQDKLDICELEHDGYSKAGVTHRRAIVRLESAAWVIVDDLLGDGNHAARLHWLAADVPFEYNEEQNRLKLSTTEGEACVQVFCNREAESDVVRAGVRVGGKTQEGDEERGWTSPCYNKLLPALSMAIEVTRAQPLPVRFITVVALGDARYYWDNSSRITIERDDRKYEVSMAKIGEPNMIASVQTSSTAERAQ